MEPRRLLPVACLATALAVVASACSLPHIRREEPRIPPLPQTSLVLDDRGQLITALHAGINRTLIPIAQMPIVLRRAVVAIEDQRFYEHHGVDVKAIIRAAVENAKSGRIVEGGSTITEQLVKNTITGDDRTLSRKIHEALLANQLEGEHSKSWILQQYLNTVYFGQGAYGIQAAAEAYFSEPAISLTLPQAATLAGIIASPSRWDPVLNPTAALARRGRVLADMVHLGMITKSQEAAASAEGLGLRVAHGTGRYPAPYFVDYVKRWFLGNPDFGATRDERYRRLFEGGLRIYTTVDLRLQRDAEQGVNSILSYPKDPYGAMTVIDPRSGAIRAMVGGRDFFSRHNPFAQVNLATGQGGTGRQSGSSFKPFALVTALANGFQPNRVYPAPAHIDIALPPHSVPPVWPVDNFEGQGGGAITLEDATIHSVNTVYAQLVRDLGGGNAFLGAARVVHTAYDMGFPRGSLHAYPSAVLGTNEVTTLEMASAFGTLATLGKRLAPMAVTKITDSSGKVVWQAEPQPVQAVLPAVAWTADQIMEKVIQQGTGIAAGIPRPAAGKTGTGQSYHDAWFVGFIPQLVAAVWVGFPQGQIEMSYPRVRIPHVLGGTWPAQIWHTFMVNATRHMPVKDFPRPTVSYDTELVDVTRNCLPNVWTLPSDVQAIKFIQGTAPTLPCAEPNGPQQVPLPSVVGLSQNDATASLQSYHFQVAVATQPSNATPGTVVSQQPAAGSTVLQGTVVTLTVASPLPSPSPTPSGKAVPDVVGMLRADAVTALQKAGFVVKVMVQWECDPPDSCSAQADVVWKQNPPADTVAALGTTVTIWANKPKV